MSSEFGSLAAAPRTAIVTGGAKRIGAALVRALSADGWHVLIHTRDACGDGQALADAIGNARTMAADLALPDAGRAVIAALDGMPPPGLLVNSASGFVYDQLGDFTVAQWDAHINANLRGTAAVIVNLLDAKLAAPNPDFFTYTVSKMGLAGLTELSARALAKQGIRVCGIAPSVTLVSGPQSRENFAAVHTLNALERGVTVAEIVAALRFILATPTFTGQTITLDGGQRFLGLARDVQYMVNA